MKHWKIATLLVFSLVFLQACDVAISVGDADGSKASVPLAVNVQAPAQGSQVPMGAVDIRYTATAPEGVAVVELSIDGYIVNSYTAPDPSQNTVALVYSWTPPTVGSHIIRVRVQDSKGTWSDYTDVMLTVTEAQPDQSAADQSSQQAQPTDAPLPTATPSTPYISGVTHDVNKFYYGNSTCGPTKITISAKVSDPSKVWSVVIFTRFMDKEGEGQSKWDTGHAMNPKGSSGEYSITLDSSKIANFNTYDYAVFRYQFVATDKNRNEVARTDVYEDIDYSICP
ncbi:MAG TPA: Ig-like domain-containing protein [Anaerolineaceae bacterium]|nr:Ig-like domain-containing protein [Anaerolineaceae bacterium]